MGRWCKAGEQRRQLLSGLRWAANAKEIVFCRVRRVKHCHGIKAGKDCAPRPFQESCKLPTGPVNPGKAPTTAFDVEEQRERVETNSGRVCLDAWHGQQRRPTHPPFPKSNCSKSAIGQGWLSAWLLDCQPSAAMKCSYTAADLRLAEKQARQSNIPAKVSAPLRASHLRCSKLNRQGEKTTWPALHRFPQHPSCHIPEERDSCGGGC